MRKRHGHPALLGLFVVTALLLLFVAVFVIAGGKLLSGKEKVVMHFNGSIYGLQVGAPVVFRGVHLGSVSAIGVAYDGANSSVIIPVVAELEREMLGNLTGEHGKDSTALSLNALVSRGLRAQLGLQSLLTGQLYVDLDFRPGKQSRVSGTEQRHIEIPTVDTPFQDLRNQVDGLDIKRLVGDLSALANSGRKLIEGPELSRAVKDIESMAANLRKLSEQLESRAGPLADNTQATLQTTREAMEKMSKAAVTVDGAAEKVSRTFNPDGPMVRDLRRVADELAKAAAAVTSAAQDEAPLNQNLQRALKDIGQAARSLRELADTLDKQPESVLKGRK
ncbi:MlaD family protein [Pelomonas sp. SE-A7]|uniref:MlaD family protein n=1 Tax=Pelomonas sp. SE-A7 TaxID=3054953 RepID=UPI00259D0074|nr:MlaD family protein [Pelomonas sp. SE-A7]MDM4764996.1 MlaD family protein [Pelomonas sp. SE-A7]